MITSSWFRVAFAVLVATGLVQADATTLSVEVQSAPGKPWTNYLTRTITSLPAERTDRVDSGLSQYGGWQERREQATGFFYPKKIGERWWLVDPEGCLFLHKAVVSVGPVRGAGANAAYRAKFGSDSNWVASTSSLLQSHGFNGVGAWSDT